MGLPMVRRLVAAGFEVVASARRPEARATCEDAGARATADAREAVRGAAAVIVCLFAEQQVHELAMGPEGFLAAMAPDALLIVHTTGSPTMTQTLAEGGVRVVDAPVSGSARDIDDGHVTVLLGGEPPDLEAARPLVASYGDPILPIGGVGSATVVKLLNNALFAAQLQLAGEVERIAGAFGVDITTAAAAIRQASGASYAMGVVERFGSLAAVAEAAGTFLAKDVAAVQQLAVDLGVLGEVNDRGPVVFEPRVS